MTSLFSVLAVLLLVGFVFAGDTGPCRYEDTLCSCKLGKANQGRCWDLISGQPGQCHQRPCKAGWTCSCNERTHLCVKTPETVNAVQVIDERKTIAPCFPRVVRLVSVRALELGTFEPALSSAGVRHDNCNQFTWWHNGLLQGEWSSEPNLDDAGVTLALSNRSRHTLLELRPGDVLAFKFNQASYYCYRHFSAINVNGLNITTSMPGVTTHYARQFSPNWFDSSFVLNSTNTAADESETDNTKFLPVRDVMLESGIPIMPKVDYWAPDEGANLDTRTGDWFWRIHIPNRLPDPRTTSF